MSRIERSMIFRQPAPARAEASNTDPYVEQAAARLNGYKSTLKPLTAEQRERDAAIEGGILIGRPENIGTPIEDD